MVQKEEIRYLKNLVEEQERTICSLEEDIVEQNRVRDELHPLKNVLNADTDSQMCK